MTTDKEPTERVEVNCWICAEYGHAPAPSCLQKYAVSPRHQSAPAEASERARELLASVRVVRRTEGSTVWIHERDALRAIEHALASAPTLPDGEEIIAALEVGLEWVIEAANESKAGEIVFINAMRDIKRIERLLAALKETRHG